MAGKYGIAGAVGAWSARHRVAAVVGWLLFVVLATAAGSVGMVQADAVQSGTGESGRAAALLAESGIPTPAQEVVIVSSSAATVDDPAFRSAVEDVLRAIEETGKATEVRSPYLTGAVSADRRTALVTFEMADEPLTAAAEVGVIHEAVTEVGERHRDLTFQPFGEATARKALNDTFAEDLTQAEWTAVPLALGILLVAFGALVAAVLPVVLAVSAVMAGFGLLALTSHVVPTVTDASSVLLLVGLAVGVDYSLFYLRREREERAAGRDLNSSLSVAAATSGRAVFVSGVTVIVAMAGMFLTGLANFKAMGVAAIIAVLVAVLGSLTVLPALLSMLGDRVDRGRIPLLGRSRKAADSRIWRSLLDRVLRFPVVASVAAVVFLLVLSAPLLGIKTAMPSISQDLDPGTPLVQAARKLEQAFPGTTSPAKVIVQAPDVDGAAMREAVAEFRAEAVATGRLYEPITVTSHTDKDILVIDVPMAGSGSDDESVAALRVLRQEVLPKTIGAVAGAETAVTGVTAQSVDFNDRLAESVVPVFVFVLVLSFLVMLASFRSVVVALTTVLLNLLSVGAAYGVLTLIFQHGFGLSLLGGHDVGAIASWVPLFLFVILFGLSMDYHVFVVSRVKEAHDRGLDTKPAIAHALRSTASVITAAAMIMVGVFLVFATLSVQSVKQIGVGLAVAVLVDATIVRVVLLPAVMALLGRANWYLPRWLNWIPDLSHESVGPVQPADRAGTLARESDVEAGLAQDPVASRRR
ncbi:MAG TPA: MMPL family transporter [Jiangellales bacterium]|nr:MMPL family transporter [Jiangellales bacterium]